MTRPRVLLAWSSGKDSAMSLHVLRQQGDLEVAGLLTTVSEAYGRVAMHAVRRSLLEAQAAAVGLPLCVVPIPSPCPNAVYEMRMAQAVAEARARGIAGIAFGDLFLEDVRRYRERQMAEPMFARPVAVRAGELAFRDGFVFADLLPAEAA